jgi:hypothetical protein
MAAASGFEEIRFSTLSLTRSILAQDLVDSLKAFAGTPCGRYVLFFHPFHYTGYLFTPMAKRIWCPHSSPQFDADSETVMVERHKKYVINALIV